MHFFPTTVAYTLHWNLDAIQAAYPGFFDLDFDYIDTDPWGILFKHLLVAYVLWLIPYLIWLRLIGYNLHRYGIPRPRGCFKFALPPSAQVFGDPLHLTWVLSFGAL